MYTINRFIKLPIKIYNEQDAELTGKQDKLDSFEMINAQYIYRYRPTWDEDDLNCVCVTFKDGTNILVYLSMQEFEEQLNNYFR